MHVCDLAVYEFADHHLGAVADGLRRIEDLVRFRVGPPASPDWASRNPFSEVWHRASGGLENHSMTSDEGEHTLRIHPDLRITLPLTASHVFASVSVTRL